MPRQKSGNFDQRQYQNDYVKKNVAYCRINFSKGDPEDMKIMEWITAHKGNEGISNYIKRLVIADMQTGKE